ncbi:MAG: cation:proton antiporter [Desulfocapsaceae bacterium]
MDNLILIGPALIFGIIAVRLGMPPMVGYLIGGFIMNIFELGDAQYFSKLGDLGVTLLLFTIGLKLNVRSLLKPYVWAGATIHMLIVVVLGGIVLFWTSLTGLQIFADLDFSIALLIAFALSFSSTVFAVKTLEEKGEMSSKHGHIAIGILIMQDIFAVVFLAISTGKVPSIWALALIGLIPLRRVLMRLMTRAGHGELMILYGLALAFGAWSVFDLVGVKGDLGALILGALMAAHPSAYEMSKKLMGFKDLLLVGFFLSIGTAGDITVPALLVAVLLAVAVVVKVGLYFFIMVRFKLRARTSVLASLILANYSEFGLIVGAVALGNGWLSGDWLVIIALALTMTFIVAAPLNIRARKIYSSKQEYFDRFEGPVLLPEDLPLDPGDAKIVIIGMERLGTGAYETLKKQYGDVVIGISSNPDIVDRHKSEGRNVLLADATDDDFWARVGLGKIKVALLAMRHYEENLNVVHRIREMVKDTDRETSFLFTVADYPEQIQSFKDAGVKAVWEFDTKAGTGFAEEVILQIGDNLDVNK